MKFKKITKKDREVLTDLLQNQLEGGDRWEKLNKAWLKRYGYSLRVQKIFDFIELLIVPSGVGEGNPFKLRPFQKKFIVDVYNPIDESGKRKVRRATLSLGRKNGKTALIACLVLVHLVGPESIINGEIYSAATTREQSSIVFKYAAQIVRADSELSSVLKVIDSTKRMICLQNGSVYAALAAEAGPAYGISASMIIYDELAQAKNNELYNALETSQGGREEPIFFVISTQSNDPQHVLSMLIDDGLSSGDDSIVCHLYAAPDDAENIFDDPGVWAMANPALNDFRSIEELDAMAKKAARMPSFESAFRNLYLNQRVDATAPLIPRAEWMGCMDKEAKINTGDEVYMGLDLSSKTDLTALVAVTAGSQSIVKSWFWKPEDSIKEHGLRDRVPYDVWVSEGWLEVTPGRGVQYEFIAARLAKIANEFSIKGVAFDRWAIENFLNAANRIGLNCYVDGKDDGLKDGVRLVNWGQGFRDMGPAIDAMELAILDRELVHDGNPILTWNISNAMSVSDPAGNRKFNKAKSRFRIDGVQALAMAIGLKSRDGEVLPVKSVYEGLSIEQMKEMML